MYVGLKVFPGAPLAAHVDRSTTSGKDAVAQGSNLQVRALISVHVGLNTEKSGDCKV